jgi:hypothetical protein
MSRNAIVILDILGHKINIFPETTVARWPNRGRTCTYTNRYISSVTICNYHGNVTAGHETVTSALTDRGTPHWSNSVNWTSPVHSGGGHTGRVPDQDVADNPVFRHVAIGLAAAGRLCPTGHSAPRCHRAACQTPDRRDRGKKGVKSDPFLTTTCADALPARCGCGSWCQGGSTARSGTTSTTHSHPSHPRCVRTAVMR